jgi:hypothetical protein
VFKSEQPIPYSNPDRKQHINIKDKPLEESEESFVQSPSPVEKETPTPSSANPPSPKTYPPDFEGWWSIYKRGNKRNAFKRWKEVSPLPDNIIAITEEYVSYCKSTERQMKDGEGWLNGGFFETTWTHAAQGTSPLGSQDKPRAI